MNSILLYDGECGFCSRVVSTVLRHERQHTLYFAALQSPVALMLLHQEPHSGRLDSVLWVDINNASAAPRVLARSSAALQLCAYLGGWWHILRVAWLVPRPLRNWLYDVVARNRHRLLRGVVCRLPTQSDRRRFLHRAEDTAMLRP